MENSASGPVLIQLNALAVIQMPLLHLCLTILITLLKTWQAVVFV